MIESVSFQNFKALQNVSVRLSPFTLVLGPNSSGKTSLLEGLNLMAQTGGAPTMLLEGGRRHLAELLTRGGAQSLAVKIEGNWNGKVAHAEVTLAMDETRGKWDWRAVAVWGDNVVNFVTDKSSDPPVKYVVSDEFRQLLASTLYLNLDVSAMARPSFSIASTQLAKDGSNLASLLAGLALADPPEFNSLIARLREVVPAAGTIRLFSTSVREEAYQSADEVPGFFKRIWIDRAGYGFTMDARGGERVRADDISAGTLLSLGVLATMSLHTRPRLILIDELERGLHPKALGELITQLRALQRLRPETQIVATSHSPYLADHFQANEIVITSLAADGTAVAGSLTDHPEFERWKNEMAPGEFWSTFGEDWLAKRSATK